MSDRPPPDLAGVAEPGGRLDVPGTAAAQIRDLAANNRLLAEGGGDPDCAIVAALLDALALGIEEEAAEFLDPRVPLPDNVTPLHRPPWTVPPGGDAA